MWAAKTMNCWVVLEPRGPVASVECPPEAEPVVEVAPRRLPCSSEEEELRRTQISACASRESCPKQEKKENSRLYLRHGRFVGGVTRQPAVVQFENPAAVSRVLFRVGHLHDGCPGLVQFTEEFHDLAGLRGVQVAGRLVGQQQRG